MERKRLLESGMDCASDGRADSRGSRGRRSGAEGDETEDGVHESGSASKGEQPSGITPSFSDFPLLWPEKRTGKLLLRSCSSASLSDFSISATIARASSPI
eukprot:COSAG02_NODE_2322_length_9135_cov_14.916335_7_plen_101_part_00